MNDRCAICGGRIRGKRSRTYCAKHYWKHRRLAEKSDWELQRVEEEAEHTKRIVERVRTEKVIDGDVAELQR